MSEPRPVKIGDIVDGRTVMRIDPYTGKYPQWFNVVLVISSPYTRSGTIERAYDDRALREQHASTSNGVHR